MSNQDIKNVCVDNQADDTKTNNQEVVFDSEIDVESLSEDEAKALLSDLLNVKSENENNIAKLKESLQCKTEEAVQLKDKWYRSAAEFENFKKRNAETRKNAYFDGKKDAITNILIIGDTIDRALSLPVDEKTKEGLVLISRQFSDTLASLGVTAIDPVGEKFDPQTCEAIHTAPCLDGEEPDTIRTVFKKGYKMDDKIIRYCQVVVTSK